jgi:tol-pal system protein YbgF
MKKLLLLALVTIVLAGCVSNSAFRSEKERVDAIESAMAQNRAELDKVRADMQASGPSAELEALTMVVREISQEQMKQNALMQEDIAYLMDRMSGEGQALPDGTPAPENPQLARRLNELAANLEQSTAMMNSKLAALESDLASMKAGSTDSKEIAELKAQMVAGRKAMQVEISSLRDAMTRSGVQSSPLKPAEPSGAVTELSYDAERNEYEAARLEYNNGNYDNAIQMLDAFIARYPNSDYAGNAYYWKGESRYAKSEWSDALKEFQVVVSRYPNSWKVADSQLKIGMCHMNMGDHANARTALNNLKRDYPYYGRIDLVNIYLNQLD